MRNHKNTDSVHPLFILISTIAILIFLMIGTNSCSASDWNDGICPNCGVRFPLYDWQKQYLKEDSFVPTFGRFNGKTFVYCIKLLLSDGEGIQRCDEIKCEDKRKIRKEDIFRYRDNMCSGYSKWFKRYCLEINQALVENGFDTIII